jgi:regulator of protease activity HflC (stomatin/prohibitin superfamily)
VPAQAAPAGRFKGETPLSRPRVRRAVMVALSLMGLALLMFVAGARVVRQDIGHVGVVRNGGPLDNRSIRQLLMPGSGVTWAGWFSQKPHEYPARHVPLLYTITSDVERGHRLGVDVVTVPTRDGVQVGIEGTVYYHFVGEENARLLRQFDKTIGTRTYTAGGLTTTPYDGDEGFQVMVENVFRPVFDNDLRHEVGAFQCAEIVTACALVKRARFSGSSHSTRSAELIEQRINESLENDMADALGGRFFLDIHFRLVRVTLPDSVQAAVTAAQAGSARVHLAKQRLRQGRFVARRDRLLADVYNESPALANINAIRAAPRQSTVIVNTDGHKAPPLLIGR